MMCRDRYANQIPCVVFGRPVALFTRRSRDEPAGGGQLRFSRVHVAFSAAELGEKYLIEMRRRNVCRARSCSVTRNLTPRRRRKNAQTEGDKLGRTRRDFESMNRGQGPARNERVSGRMQSRRTAIDRRSRNRKRANHRLVITSAALGDGHATPEPNRGPGGTEESASDAIIQLRRGSESRRFAVGRHSIARNIVSIAQNRPKQVERLGEWVSRRSGRTAVGGHRWENRLRRGTHNRFAGLRLAARPAGDASRARPLEDALAGRRYLASAAAN